jgi:hypothetical protein
MIKKFGEFNRIDESVLYYAPPFRELLELLSRGSSDIADKLLELEMEDLPTDITFINSAEDVGYLTFHSMPKAIEKIKKNYNDIRVTSREFYNKEIDININKDLKKRIYHDSIYNSEISGLTHMSIYTDNKNAIKIGKFIKKVLPNTTDAQIEDFVNELKAIQDNLKEKIELVSGDEIEKWYKSKNCYPGGTLERSCMVNKDFFDIYTKNPESVNLLIMKSGDKIVARALVWKIKSTEPKLGFTYYMDRVYTVKDHQEKVMIAFAEKQGWAYRVLNNVFIYQGKKYDSVKMSVKIKKLNYEKYPYMDTFSRYDYVTGLLWNDYEKSSRTRGHILHSTEGGYSKGMPRGLIRRWGDYFGLDIPPLIRNTNN